MKPEKYFKVSEIYQIEFNVNLTFDEREILIKALLDLMDKGIKINKIQILKVKNIDLGDG